MEPGRFGPYGGKYIPETLMSAIQELETAYDTFKDDAIFQKELNTLYQNYASRPSLLTYAENVTKDLAGAKKFISNVKI